MRNGDRTVTLQQQLGHGFADDVRTADDERTSAGHIRQHLADQNQTSERSAGHGCLFAQGQASGIDGVKPIDVFRRSDGSQHGRAIDPGGQGQLH